MEFSIDVAVFSGSYGLEKTSLVLAIASQLHLNVYLLNLEGLTEEGLINLSRKLPQHCVLLLEDIDSNHVLDSFLSTE